MAAYTFLTTFSLPTTRDRVFTATAHLERWAHGWPEVIEVTVLDEGDGDGLGRTLRVVLRAPMGYRLTFRTVADRIEPNHRVDVAADGDLVGRGSWRLVEDDGITHGSYLWEVRTTRTWMNLLAPLARLLFVSNHDRAMRHGIHALAKHLGVVPLEVTTGRHRAPRPAPTPA